MEAALLQEVNGFPCTVMIIMIAMIVVNVKNRRIIMVVVNVKNKRIFMNVKNRKTEDRELNA